MNILYATDHKFIKCGQKLYSIEFNNDFFLPYKKAFDKVTVVGRYIESDSNNSLESVDIDFIALPNISTLFSFFGVRQHIKKYLEELIKKYDFVIARLPSEIGLLSIKIAHKTGKSVLVELVGDAYEMLKHYGTLKAYLYAPFMKERVYHAIKSADFIIYVTDSYLQNIYPSSKYATTESISNVHLFPASDKEIEIKYKEFNRADITFGVMANIDMKFKGIDILIKAFYHYIKKYPNAKLKIAGAGDTNRYKKLLQKLNISESIIFDGVIYGKNNKSNWFDNIDIYIQPSLTEGLPRALIEAMGRGCIAIASNAGGIVELLDKDYLFKAGDIKQLYFKLLDITQIDNYKNISFYNRDKVVSRYSKILLEEKRRRVFEILKNQSYGSEDIIEIS